MGAKGRCSGSAEKPSLSFRNCGQFLSKVLRRRLNAPSIAWAAFLEQVHWVETAFEGLTQDATATALTKDQDCRMTLFNKMFDAITIPTGGTTVQSGNCSIASGGSATGNSINCGPAQPASAPN
jgi:autotransporter passenger strand-loop-strand repeat protein